MSQIELKKPMVWSYNGVELELDMTDPGVVEKYELSCKKMEDESKAMPKDGMKSVLIRHYCTMIRNFLDRIFGEGTSNKLVEKESGIALTDCYESFLDFVASQNQLLSDKQNRITSRYSPNRAQRRAATKN